MSITDSKVYERDLSLTAEEAVEDHETFIARLFASLFEIGGSQVEYYYGDFARDVFWMQRNFDELLAGKTFYYGTRLTGTSIGFDRSEVCGMNSATFEVKVVQTARSWGHKLVAACTTLS